MPGEFDIIKDYFSFSSRDPSVLLGVGDDAAVVEAPNIDVCAEQSDRDKYLGKIVVATDTLLEGVHFPVGMSAAHIAQRSLLVNVSDFAAMGVRPRWFTMALTLPEVNKTWLGEFSASLQGICNQLDLALVGGDTVKGPLSILSLIHISEPTRLR